MPMSGENLCDTLLSLTLYVLLTLVFDHVSIEHSRKLAVFGFLCFKTEKNFCTMIHVGKCIFMV